jgi:uncharacterized phage infection (PIP) family protein YhgE
MHLLNVRSTWRKSARRSHAGDICLGTGVLMASTRNHEEPRTNAQLERLEEQLSKLGLGAARDPSDPQTRMSTFRAAVLGDRQSLRGWALRGTGFLLAACIGVAAIAWWQPSHGDAAKTAPPQPAPRAQTAPEDVAPTAAMSPQLTQQFQSMARDLATLAQGIEQLKASQDQLVRDNANVADQLRASQEEAARNNANVAEQLKASQEQLVSVLAKVSEQDLRPKISSPSPPRPTAAPTRRPATAPSPQATAQVRAQKPQLAPAPGPPVR